MGYYKTAQICLKGHVITLDVSYSAGAEKFCSQCGAETITSCTFCGTDIRGEYFAPGVFTVSQYSSYKPPAFCYNCGKAFPWAILKMKVIEEWIDKIDDLSSEEKSDFRSCLPGIISDEPRTSLASLSIRRYIERATPEIKAFISDALKDVATETAKKFIWPD